MWWRLGVLATVTCALLLFLFAPFTSTVRIKLDLPPSADPASARQVQATIENTVWIGEAVLVTAILGTAGWIAWRIVRRYRISN
jgi:hypothetical protein